MVSATKLKTDFVKYEKSELEKLSSKECDAYVESLVAELFKSFKNGVVVDDPDSDEIVDLLNSYMEVAKNKFKNAAAVVNNRKYRYLYYAYITATVTSTNHFYDLRLTIIQSMISTLYYSKIILKQLLRIYYYNYSNYGMLNDLFYKLSTVENLDITFEIHEKYLNNEFGVNQSLMNELNIYIEIIVEKIFDTIDKFEKFVDIDEISGEGYFDNNVAEIKNVIKKTFNKADDFEKTALINSGFDSAMFHEIENVKSEIYFVESYLSFKEWFMNLYNNNGFAELSESAFNSLKEKKINNDFDEFMKKEPKYDLKNFQLIKPEIKRLAF